MAKSNDKKALLLKIQQLSFSLTEANLYLDSHPTCESGIAYFKKKKAELDKAREEYKSKYGALIMENALDDDDRKWQWVCEPFPWISEYERGQS